jgi:hypothetical protein
MGVLKVKDPSDPTGNTWVDIAGTGTQGAPGGPVPVGGNPGEVIVKTGPADMEVGWAARPRVAFRGEINQVNASATPNTMVPLISGDITIYPDRVYHFFAGIRCIQDPAVADDVMVNAQFRVYCGTVGLHGNDVVGPMLDPRSAWGAWSQTYLYNGTSFVAADQPPATMVVELRGQMSVASKLFYTPRLFVIEY